MNDILSRLRENSQYYSEGYGPLCAEAADEIERLQIERDTWRNNANAWAALAVERGGNLNVDHAREIVRLRAALREIAAVPTCPGAERERLIMIAREALQ